MFGNILCCFCWSLCVKVWIQAEINGRGPSTWWWSKLPTREPFLIHHLIKLTCSIDAKTIKRWQKPRLLLKPRRSKQTEAPDRWVQLVQLSRLRDEKHKAQKLLREREQKRWQGVGVLSPSRISAAEKRRRFVEVINQPCALTCLTKISWNISVLTSTSHGVLCLAPYPQHSSNPLLSFV